MEKIARREMARECKTAEEWRKDTCKEQRHQNEHGRCYGTWSMDTGD